MVGFSVTTVRVPSPASCTKHIGSIANRAGAANRSTTPSHRPNKVCVALVTGFSKGRGWAMAQALAGAACSVAFNVTDKSAVRPAVESVGRQFASQQLGIVSRNLLHDLTDHD